MVYGKIIELSQGHCEDEKLSFSFFLEEKEKEFTEIKEYFCMKTNNIFLICFVFVSFFTICCFFPLVQELESIAKLLESKLRKFLCYDGVLVEF